MARSRRRQEPFSPAQMLSGALDAFRLPAHEVHFREGEQGERMYVVLEGCVDILVGDNVIETASEGDIVGEMALIDNAPRSASVIANTECRLVGIDRDRFHLLVQRNPAFSTHVMKVLANRLRHMNWLVLASPKS
jgi:CRP/FNR family transcriptional regulator, cyclic AMP receptor protein